MTIAGHVALTGFRHVDRDPNAAALIAALDEQAAMPAIQQLRAAAVGLLRPRLGDRLLDVGCGTGEVVRALAGLVGTDGTVIGIDPSATMLDEALRRTGDSTLPVEVRSGDIASLDFDDATFDGVTCERVFQHLDAPDTAMAELVRVTKPGGRLVVTDTGWGMHAIHGADPDIATRIIACWSDNAVNGCSGRQLPALFARAGIPDPMVIAETFTTTDPRRPSMAPFTPMADAATTAGAVTTAEATSWLGELAEVGAAGGFFWAVTMFAVGGVRPSPSSANPNKENSQ